MLPQACFRKSAISGSECISIYLSMKFKAHCTILFADIIVKSTEMQSQIKNNLPLVLKDQNEGKVGQFSHLVIM